MLTNLKIQNFRCLEDLTFNHLAQVNLLVGRNNVGKSTVLEALRIYAGNANQELLEEIAKSHDEKCFLDEDNSLPYEDLFTGRKFSEEEVAISIGEINNEQEHLKIYHVYKTKKDYIQEDDEGNRTNVTKEISVTQLALVQDNCILDEGLLIQKKRNSVGLYFNIISQDFRRFATITPMLKCSFIPTQLISSGELAKEWDNIIKDWKYENDINKALQIIDSKIEGIRFIQGKQERYPVVKLSDYSKAISLKSLGEGLLRVLQIILKLIPAKGGFLLIDEFENGLHYSVQEKVWNLLFKMAQQLDVQIFATTHSWDCVKSFRTVWEKEENQDKGSFHRLSLDSNKKIKAFPYNCQDLNRSIERDIEVR